MAMEELTAQEVNTIIAALRFYQMNGKCDPHRRDSFLHDIATNFDQETSMDTHGVDELCEKLNFDAASYSRNTMNGWYSSEGREGEANAK
jgi:hypothetical protein